ncbi:MAG: hypothetical protein LBE82_03980 [Chitinophagaceae bacterium]|jgi:hypothetical protein|nr:hypothetical protein [Chitinophagaceae bacterium]
MTKQKQFCEEHNSLARHAELVSASPKTVAILTESKRCRNKFGMTARRFIEQYQLLFLL